MNPFRDSIVANPWDGTRADVTSIHHDVFEACLRGIETVRTGRRSAAILIHGEAGSGKTHLLSRLRSHLAPREATATDRVEYLYVWVRLQTSPRMIWRTLRRTLVDDWFRPISGHRSQFERILFHRLAEIRIAEGDLEPWYEFMLDEHPDGLRELIDRIADNLDLDRNTAVAFEHIAFGRHRRDLRAWLAGDSLPEAALEKINLTSDEGTDEEHEAQARQVVLMLCRLAGNGLPIVLSFDQVEALQVTPRDQDGPFAFGQMVSTLHDGTSNLLLISCIQSAFFRDIQQTIRGADYARMTSLGAMSLHSLNATEAEQLIAARLQATDETAPEESSLTACWPLDSKLVSELATKADLTPRKLLSLCADRYDSWQSSGSIEDTATTFAPAPIPSSPPPLFPSSPTSDDTNTFLTEKWRSTLDQKSASNTPDQTDEIIRHGLPLLSSLLLPDQQPIKDDSLREIGLLFEGPLGRLGISIRTESNMGSLGAKFGRLAQDLESGLLQRVVLIRDFRRPITKTAKVAQKKLDELQQSGAIIIEPSLEVLVALDTLREILSDAKSGDLDVDGQTVSAQAVEEWLKGNIDELLRSFITNVFGPS